MSDERPADATLRFRAVEGVRTAAEMLDDAEPVDRVEVRVWFAGGEEATATRATGGVVAEGGGGTDNHSAPTTEGTTGTTAARTGTARDHTCDTCGKTFDTGQQLVGHQAVHANRDGKVTPWVCASDDDGEDSAGLRSVSPNTAAHSVLAILHEETRPGGTASADTAVVEAALDERGEYAPSNAAGALVTLYRSLLCERRKTSKGRGTGWTYEYRITSHGRAEIERMGEPSARGAAGDDSSVTITPATGRHEVLTLVGDHTETGGWVDTGTLAESVSGVTVASRSVGPTLTLLTRGGYVERRLSGGEQNAQMYEYRLSEKGEEALDRIGAYSADGRGC